MPAMPMALRRPPMVVGIRHTRRDEEVTEKMVPAYMRRSAG
jgi:hypothetical protein